MIRILAAAIVAVATFAVPAARAQTQAAPKAFVVGYVELANDARYDEDYAYARVQLRPLGRPFAGAELGIGDAATIGRVVKVDFSLRHQIGDSVDALVATAHEWIASGVHFIVADLPTADLLAFSDALRDEPVIIFNVTDPDDSLRGAECRANLVHAFVSHSMETDALVQFIISRHWRTILALQGEQVDDADLIAALKRSAQRFGAKIVDVRPFELSNDPRDRERNNVALMTSGADYDVVFLADSDGEFGRYVPYETSLPRPVIGTSGLVPEAWHWSWDRHGAPQLNSRFEKAAGRRMTGTDWAAWVSIKALVQSVLRTKSTDYEPVRDYLLGEKLNLDGAKGNTLSVRSWDHQIRQPVLLATTNAIIERAPIPGFLHQTNELDTLGYDAPETGCTFK